MQGVCDQCHITAIITEYLGMSQQQLLALPLHLFMYYTHPCLCYTHPCHTHSLPLSLTGRSLAIAIGLLGVTACEQGPEEGGLPWGFPQLCQPAMTNCIVMLSRTWHRKLLPVPSAAQRAQLFLREPS